jgi:Mn2+/Fe2+ NRAMP family transporter
MRFVPHEAHNLTAIILLLLLHLTFNRGSNYNIYDAVCCFCGVVMCLCYCCVCYMYRLTYNIIIDSSESKPKYLHIGLIGNTTTVNVLLLCVLCSATSATSARRRVTRQGAFLSTPFGPSASAGREEIDR